MHTVLNTRLMDALESLRAQGQYTFPCTFLRDGQSVDALLGPRMDGNTVRVKVGEAKAQEAELGVVSVCGETVAQLEAEADRLNLRAVATKMANRGAKSGSLGSYAGRGYGR